MNKTLIIIANNNIGPGQSGGDTIFLELSKHWQNKLNITIFGSEETKNLIQRYHLNALNFIKTDIINSNFKLSNLNIITHTFRRIVLGIYQIFKNYKHIKSFDYCYTVSDFYPDFFLGLIYKIINPQGIWISGHFLFVPNPFSNKSPYKLEKLKGWLYYISQIPTRYLSQKFADIIYITSKPDAIHFKNKKIVIIRGGVNTQTGFKYLKQNKKIKKIYDGLFFGRLHPQKGVLELVDIWKMLCHKLPKSKLAIIGDGALETALIKKIKLNKLEKNIKLFGFQNGKLKNKIIKQSKIILHPAIFDSGGMAAAEAMSFGLPGVSFNLPALKTYYPQGMIKTPINNLSLFAQNIYLLLTDKKLYNNTSFKALELIKNKWDWKKQANTIYEKTFN